MKREMRIAVMLREGDVPMSQQAAYPGDDLRSDSRLCEDGDVARVVGCILVENLHGRKA